jgi:hypothetical protein
VHSRQVESVVANRVVLRFLVPYRAILAAVSVHENAAPSAASEIVSRDEIAFASIDGQNLPSFSGFRRESASADNVISSLWGEVN